MRKILGALAKISAAFCALLFILTTLLALLAFNLERRLFNPRTYERVLSNQNFYVKMPGILAAVLSESANTNLDPCRDNPIACGAGERLPVENACFENALGLENYQTLASNQRKPTLEEISLADDCLKAYGLDTTVSEGGPAPFMQNLSAQDWEVILTALFPPEELKVFADHALETVFAYVNGKSDSAVVSMVSLKKRLSGEAGIQVVKQLMDSQPACTVEQLSLLTDKSEEGSDTPICKPPEELLPTILPIMQAQLQLAAAGIPDEATLIPPVTNEDGKGGLMTLRMLMRLSPIIPLIFLLGITIFAIRSLITWLFWWGYPLIAAGISGMITGLGSMTFISSRITDFIFEKVPAGTPAILIQTIIALTNDIIRQTLKPVIGQGIFLLILGMSMIGSAYYVGHTQSRRILNSEAKTII